MKKLKLLFAFLLPYILSNAQPQKNSGFPVKIDAMLSAQFRPQEPGGVALITRNGKVVYSKAFGMANIELNIPMKPGNIFRIASITKQFTAVAILQLMEQGKINLQDNISRFIPDYPAQGNKISIEHLLTHTSGIQDYTRIKDYSNQVARSVSPAEMIDYFKNEPLRFAPGTKWEYSNSNYFILGYIIEKLSGKTYAQYLEDSIFKPLGMSASTYASDSRIINNRASGYTRGDTAFENAPQISMTQPYAAGAILSTVGDLAKWQQAVQTDRLVKKQTINKAFTRYELTDGSATGYGYGWRIGRFYESSIFWHGGLINGFAAIELYLPKEDVFVTILTNCDCNKPEDIAMKMAAYVIGVPSDYKAISLDSTLLTSYTGVYANDNGEEQIVTTEGSKIYSQRGKGPKIQVQPWEKDKFYSDDALQTMEYNRDRNGGIETLTVRSRRGNELWTRTNKPIPADAGIILDETILYRYTGTYQITPEFSFTVTKENDELYLQASGQEKLQMTADSETQFFLKVNGAEIEFVKDAAGNVATAVFKQGGRKSEAKKIK
jgi:CubicO group peptidase (beta-lactamase class C family)